MCVRQITSNVKRISSAFKNRIASFRIDNNTSDCIYPTEFLQQNEVTAITLLESQLRKHKSIKFNIELFGEYVLPDSELPDIKSFNTKNQMITISSDLENTYKELIDNIQAKSEEFELKNSGWSITSIKYMEININKYAPLRGSSYLQLPSDIYYKRACVNIINNDNKCFLWAILAARNPTSNNIERMSSYPPLSTLQLNLRGIEFPLKLKDIARFEDQNELSINVYGFEYNGHLKKHMINGPLHFTKQKKAEHINLLYIDNEFGDGHFCLIKNLKTLVNSQHSSHEHNVNLCDGCLMFFPCDEQFARHQSEDCNKITTKVPQKYSSIEFNNYKNKIKVPFVVYADFECILTPIHHTLPETTKSSTTSTQLHEPSSFSYYIKCEYDPSLSKFVTYRGENCAEKFVQNIRDDAKRIYIDHLKEVVPMIYTSLDQHKFNRSRKCYICGKPFSVDDIKVRDHCHITGEFRGAAHNNCNLNFKTPQFLPIFFHNLSGYDSHLFIKQLASSSDDSIKVIANNKESYISFSQQMKVDEDDAGKNVFIDLRFLDSFRFMASGLDKLAKSLHPSEFKELKKQFDNEEDFKLLQRKGVFPYEYVDNWNKYNVTELPSIESFYSRMTNKHISAEDYSHAKNIWEHFNISNLGEYSDLYLKTDVFLLTDIFENFRELCMKTYDLDPCHYYTTPGLSWDAMLKYTGVEISNLTDIDMIHFIKKGIRGGISQCSNRYGKANNKYMPNYDSNKPSNYLLYLDANNLYGWAMSQSLPLCGFKWLDESEIENLNRNKKFDDNENIGYFLECDIEYPQSLHDMHNDFPFCAENVTPPNGKFSKLIPNLNDKSKYIIHSKMLQQCIENGLILKKIYRGIQFNQSKWLESYINLNTEMRKKATSKFEKDFFKLMNNAIYGKTMENVEKRRDIKLVTHWDNIGQRQGAAHLISKLNFKSSSIFTNNFVAIHLTRTKIMYDKPIFVGFSVLELSKCLMYDFHYKYIMEKYSNRVKLLYTDTDSFVYDIKTDDFYNDIKNDITQYFDTSEYPENNQYNLERVNSKVLGKFKDELTGELLLEFCGLRSKMYAIISESTIIKKAKGVNRPVVEELRFDDYHNCLETNEIILRTMHRFQSIMHSLVTRNINKIALSAHDDKRFLISNSTDTLAWGHYRINEFDNEGS